MSGASLLLCHRLPFPPNRGDKIRSHALLKHLAERGPVHVGCFVDDPQDLQYCNDVRALAGGQCHFEPVSAASKWWRAGQALLSGQSVTTGYFRSPSLSRWVKNIVRNEPLSNRIVFGSAMAPYLLAEPKSSRRVLFDMVDVDSDKWRQYAQSSSGVMRWIYSREARIVADLETRSARAFGMTLLVSEFEAATFRAMVPDCADKIGTLNNGVDLEKFSPGVFACPFPGDELPIVMTGRMDYRPNVDGAVWFARRVVPRILSILPKAHIYFVGSNPSRALRDIEGPNVTVTGEVDDVRQYLQSAAAVVAPLLIARGVQNKVLEAMAMRKPVVATHEATRALDVKPGIHLWIENDTQRFADAVVAAIRSPARDAVMASARRYVEQHHNWSGTFQRLDLVLDGLSRDAAGRIGMPERAAGTSPLHREPGVAGAKA